MNTRAPATRTDRDLARAVARRGEEQAFRELYRRHTPRLLGFVHRLLGPAGAEAEDVVQETWIRACENLTGFRWDSSFSTWLLGIGLNLTRERRRRSTRRRLESAENLSRASATASRSEERIDLSRAIERLAEGHRLALVLHDIEGMKHGEIAERLGISTGTSKSQLHDARRAMRAMLRGAREETHE